MGILQIIATFSPVIVKAIMSVFDFIKLKDENKRHFLEDVIHNSNHSMAVKLRDEYKELLKDDSPREDDVFT